MMNGETNVKVAVRIRSSLDNDESDGVSQYDGDTVIVNGKECAFSFDYVFNKEIGQSHIFGGCVVPIIQSFLDGYNTTIFAYGQTGSGKTYTINGNEQDGEESGIIWRSLYLIYSQILDRNKQENYDFSIKVSYVEVYKEEVFDLLSNENREVHIREDERGNTILVGNEEIACESLEEIISLLKHGTDLRITGVTQMNDRSSRSHTIFTIFIEQKWTDLEGETATYNILSSKMNFVDLAGSERINKTGNSGLRLKESIYINSGLLVLGNVISALSEKKSVHVPYRDSKITRILKDSLGGNSRTLMICCVSPAPENTEETFNSLKYASRARKIKNKAVKNANKFEHLLGQVRDLRRQLEKSSKTDDDKTRKHFDELKYHSKHCEYLIRQMSGLNDNNTQKELICETDPHNLNDLMIENSRLSQVMEQKDLEIDEKIREIESLKNTNEKMVKMMKKRVIHHNSCTKSSLGESHGGYTDGIRRWTFMDKFQREKSAKIQNLINDDFRRSPKRDDLNCLFSVVNDNLLKLNKIDQICRQLVKKDVQKCVNSIIESGTDRDQIVAELMEIDHLHNKISSLIKQVQNMHTDVDPSMLSSLFTEFLKTCEKQPQDLLNLFCVFFLKLINSNKLSKNLMDSGETSMVERTHKLEKELYFYKRSLRDLKKSLKFVFSFESSTPLKDELISILNTKENEIMSPLLSVLPIVNNQICCKKFSPKSDD